MAEVKLCSISGCNKPKKPTSKLYCAMHYQRKRTGKDMRPEPFIFLKRETLNYFNSIQGGSSDCIIWPFYRNSHGYGEFSNPAYKSRVVSRNICIKFHGSPKDESYEAAHSCGRGGQGCVNPDHLSWKSHKSNHEDRIGHGTNLAGSTNPMSKLTEQNVLDMRRMRRAGCTYQYIADAFNISLMTSYNACIGKTWQHVF